MENEFYLDFDEAVSFLKTTPSTMYKWLQAGKVPGYKLGRQWRFLKNELEFHISGNGSSDLVQKENLELKSLLKQRAINNFKTEKIKLELAEVLIWDAFEHGARVIHLGPYQGNYEIRYRQRKGSEQLITIQELTFNSLDQCLRQKSIPIRDGDMRRLFLKREDGTQLQVRYQKVETVVGARLTLQIWNPQQDVLSLEKITNRNFEVLQIFKNWMQKKSGLILICGAPGSGKTTTVHSLLKEMQTQGQVIFSVENPVEILIEGINQLELARKTKEDFEQIYEKISFSDPDVLALEGSSIKGLEKIIIEKAFNSIKAGHLVILQWAAASAEEALAQIQKYTDDNVDSKLIGCCHQKLVPSAYGLKAIYQFPGKN